MSSNSKIYITIVSPFSIEGRWFSIREQLEYSGESIIMRGEYFVCDESDECLPISEFHHKGLDSEGNEFYIPERFSVLDTVFIPEDERSIFNKVAKRRQDSTKDYYKAVKDVYNIDMKLNHSPQVNPEHYKRIDLIPPGEKTGSNRNKEGDL